MYSLLVGQGWVSPAEFWRLAPGEIWWLIDAKMPKAAPGVTPADLEDMYQALKAAKAEEVA